MNGSKDIWRDWHVWTFMNLFALRSYARMCLLDNISKYDLFFKASLDETINAIYVWVIVIIFL